MHQLSSLSRISRALALLSFCALAACAGEVLDPAGDIARQQRDIIYVSTGLLLLIIVPVLMLIVLFAWRYRKGGQGTYDPAFDHSTGLELAIWSAPLLIIIALGALTWSSTHLLDPFRPLPAKEGTKPLLVQVVSLDWKWLFIYPEEGIATINELVLPVGRPVRFDITSSNMMNTFYAPTMAGMIYAMPGMQSQLHAVLNRQGEFQGFSANYSGAGFSGMRFLLKGVDDAAFVQWLEEARISGGELGLPAYREIAMPSEKAPVTRFASIDRDLYRRILERCVDPGTICTSELSRHTDHAPAPRSDSRP
jgi:cytochrome o ubiquinol oxidase subunit II